jgi:hypothetical protein
VYDWGITAAKNQLQTGEAYSVVGETVGRMEGLLAVGDKFMDD